MQYYLLSNATDEKIIGKKHPQCKGIPSHIGNFQWFDEPNSMTKLTSDEFPGFDPELIFELEEEAILTDVVSPSNISAKGFLVNQKVKDILSSFNLMEHRYYPATLIYRSQDLPYFWLHFKENKKYFIDNINFEKTKFHLGNLARWKEGDLEISSTDDYYKKEGSIGFKTINIEYLSLYEIKEELFYFNNLHEGFLISNELATTIYTLKISGFKISKPSFIIE
jgi:hypothetical protein